MISVSSAPSLRRSIASSPGRRAPAAPWRRALVASLGFLASVVLAAAAPSVRWIPGSGTLGLSQTSELQLLFDDCAPEDAPQLPAVDGLSISQPPSMSQETQIINMSMSRRVRLTYGVRPLQRRTIRIPEFDVRTDKGTLRVAAATFEVGEATLGGTGVTLKDAATSHFTVPTDTVWAGQVFPLTYTLQLARRYYHSIDTRIEWDPAPLLIEDWGKPEPLDTSLRGEPAIDVVYRTRALAREPGNIRLSSATQLVNLVTGASVLGPFQRNQLDQYAVPSDQPTLRVRPLPAPAPTAFTGAVGQFELKSTVVPLTAQVGEPITWTLTLTGTGNWPDIQGLPARGASRDFRVVQPQAKRDAAATKLFEATLSEDVVLVPTRAGTYPLGPLTWTYFDPAKGAYETVTTERFTVTISAPPTPPASAALPSAETPAAAAPTLPPPVAPVPPSALPRDPLPGASLAPVPLRTRDFVLLLLGTAVLWVPVWLVFAWRHARVTDPARPRREAVQRLAATIEKIRTATTTPLGGPASGAQLPALNSQLLLHWQRDTALLFQLRHAVPRAELLDPAWATLWRETERALYSATAALPPDWATRASAALTAHRLPKLPPYAWLLPRNLLPFVATLALCTLALPPLLRAQPGPAGGPAVDRSSKLVDREPAPAPPTASPSRATPSDPRSASPVKSTVTPSTDPVADYKAGRFAPAAAAWRQRLTTVPTDAFAHHNLALALIQQNQPGEAAAHWVAATLQAPREESIRWHLDYIFARAGYIVPEAQALARPGPVEWLARQASPGTWQRLLIGATTTLSVALIFVLIGAYTRRRTALPAALLTGCALLALLAGGLALQHYGKLAAPRAALVWKPSILRSVPTEADLTQQTTALSAGTVAVIDNQFLTWRRLVLPGGQTGWITADALLPLWE